MIKWKEMARGKYFLTYIERESLSHEFGRFCIQPLKRGYGAQLETSLRSALLKNLSGIAAAAMRFKLESVQLSESRQVEMQNELIKNVRKIKLVTAGNFPLFASIKKVGHCDIFASDFHFSVPVQLLVPNRVLGQLYARESIGIDIILHFGKGVVSDQDASDVKIPKGWIPLDRNYSPVNQVKTEILPISTSKHQGAEQLLVEIATDGSMSPEDALRRAMSWIRSPMDHSASA